jgi:hypothetical protein
MIRHFIRTKLKKILLILALVFAAIQFYYPAHTNPPIDETLTIQSKQNVPPEILAILDRSCGDCHSSKTNWLWYTNVAPVSWFTVNHVHEGRSKLNFSEWGKYDSSRQSRRLNGICNQCKRGEMPLESYLLLHPRARLTPEEVNMICDWVTKERARIAQEEKIN